MVELELALELGILAIETGDQDLSLNEAAGPVGRGVGGRFQLRLVRAIKAHCCSHGPEKVEGSIWDDLCN